MRVLTAILDSASAFSAENREGPAARDAHPPTGREFEGAGHCKAAPASCLQHPLAAGSRALCKAGEVHSPIPTRRGAWPASWSMVAV
jgi:hypothetical protein